MAPPDPPRAHGENARRGRGRPPKKRTLSGALKRTSGDSVTRSQWAGLLQCILSDVCLQDRDAAVCVIFVLVLCLTVYI